jgi:hypothetical protein
MTSNLEENSKTELNQSAAKVEKVKKESNPIIDILFNIVLPSFVLTKLSGEDKLGPLNSFYLALSIPFAFSIWSLVKEKKFSWMALLGFVNIALSGGLRFFEVGRIGFALKEALTPLMLGAAVLFSLSMKTPLVEKLIYSDKVVNKELINKILNEKGLSAEFRNIMVKTTFILAFSFLLSAALNFGLAVYLLKSPTTSPEFNVELGKMTALSFPVIALPCMAVVAGALVYLTQGIKKLTGLSTEEILNPSAGAKK